MGQTLMLAGHAKLPKGMAARDVYETLTVTAEVDSQYGVILEASCTLLTSHAHNYFNQLLKGLSLKEGLEPVIDMIASSYHGKAKEALIAACKDMYYYYIE
ncbi:DUF3870 domain-containing protein [Tuberibacillus sp. Marseille-P3662]|uniref:DUF3870 domain-containing protein n=1 Tax=Tuberibacillus sp. Marseille-P3662 TaxID=1965358 RepID=UPI000A1CE7EB|nr:DUF3870 domain-containing protein [Tuberibacillus sp. Marseille-P3662]